MATDRCVFECRMILIKLQSILNIIIIVFEYDSGESFISFNIHITKIYWGIYK